MHSLGDFEHLVLLAVIRLEDNAYGVTIRSELGVHTGRQISPGALYTTLDRLEQKGLLASRIGPPSPERGGRAKRLYVVTPMGCRVLADVQRVLTSMWRGLHLAGANA